MRRLISLTYRSFFKRKSWCFVGFFVLFSEALTLPRQPDKPTIVVEGVNNTNVDLIWDFLPASGEVVQSIFLNRERPGYSSEQIASRKSNTAFNPLISNFETEYRANLPATLRLVNVDNTEEYIYSLEVNYDDVGVPKKMLDEVRVIVRGEFCFLPLTNLGLLLKQF